MGGNQYIDSGGSDSNSQLAGKIITINGQHHLITTSKPLPQLKRIAQSQVSLLRFRTFPLIFLLAYE